jgi:CubicO group peptidase (beta-lactamase class C family)
LFSLSKPVTAVLLLLRLAERGLLDLTNLQHLRARAAGGYASATLRQLLRHTSGNPRS